MQGHSLTPPSPEAPDAGTDWVHVNPWFRVGLRDGWYRVVPNHVQVAVLATVGPDLVLVRVHRPLLGGTLVEVPAGCAEPRESPAEAMRRELAEETGIQIPDAARFQPLPPLAVSPDRFGHWPHLFKVEISEEEFACRQHHDAEIAEVLRLNRVRVLGMVASGELRACLPMAMLFRHFCPALLDLETAHA